MTTLRHRRALRAVANRKPCKQQPVAPVVTLLAAALVAAVLLLIFTR